MIKDSKRSFSILASGRYIVYDVKNSFVWPTTFKHKANAFLHEATMHNVRYKMCTVRAAPNLKLAMYMTS